MKTFLFKDYEKTGFESFAKDFSPEVKKALVNECVSTKYGEGKIIDFYLSVNSKADITVKIKSKDSSEKCFYLFTSMASGAVKFEKDITELCAVYTEICAAFYAKQQKEEEALMEARHATEVAKKEAELKAKKEEAITRRFADELYKVKHLSTFKVSNFQTDFFTSLGWLASHAKTLTAAMPDVIESWFVSQFGDVKRTVVDSTKRTVNGFPMQWAFSLKLAVKNIEMLPAYFNQYRSKDGKCLANTEFLYTLASDYGFEFGVKEQNVDKIKSHVPVDYLEYFEAGSKLA